MEGSRGTSAGLPMEKWKIRLKSVLLGQMENNSAVGRREKRNFLESVNRELCPEMVKSAIKPQNTGLINNLFIFPGIKLILSDRKLSKLCPK